MDIAILDLIQAHLRSPLMDALMLAATHLGDLALVWLAAGAVLAALGTLLLLIRAVPIFVALSTGKDTRDISTHNRLTIALYCTTALPIIVAVTSVAVSAGAMPQETASVLALGAGAITKWLFDRARRIERAPNVKNIEAYIERVEEMAARKRALIFS